MTKPTPAELLAQARKLTAALADYSPADLVAEGMALINTSEFQGYMDSFEAIVRVLPEGDRFKGVFNNLATSARAAKALAAQDKMAAEAKAAAAQQ